MTAGRIIRHGSLAVIVAVGAWLLWPTAADRRDDPRAADGRATPADVKFVIKFSPGQAYFPDSRPYGLGKPLDPFIKKQ